MGMYRRVRWLIERQNVGTLRTRTRDTIYMLLSARRSFDHRRLQFSDSQSAIYPIYLALLEKCQDLLPSAQLAHRPFATFPACSNRPYRRNRTTDNGSHSHVCTHVQPARPDALTGIPRPTASARSRLFHATFSIYPGCRIHAAAQVLEASGRQAGRQVVGR
jgi:hypothetical protein